MKIRILIIMAAVLLAGCRSGSPAPAEPAASAEEPAAKAAEQVLPPASLSMMGKVVAVRHADMSFETVLPISRVNVHDGQRVHRGQVLAELDQFKLRNAVQQQRHMVEQAMLQVEQARLQMQDVVIAQGYDPDKASSVPESVLHNADVKSGYALSQSSLEAARTQLAAAEHALRDGVLRAPFDGVVANVAMQAHQLSQPGQTVCRIIDASALSVEFRVMEADLARFPIGARLNVVPVSARGTMYEAVVSEINPVVDAQGAVTIRARLSKADGLFEGMNAEVLLK
ncbi:MAG: efflux RND transporter periplasmic adaptor subunit [Bacteroidales bacterium]|nr:efflux RND transporter periplasmic adaptor subunit [Bacteroidales bacterium]